MVEDKMWTNFYILYGVTVASVTQKKFQERKGIWNHLQCRLQERIWFQINILTDESPKDQSIPPYLEKSTPVFESLIKETNDHNSTEDYCNGSTDTSRNYKEDSEKSESRW